MSCFTVQVLEPSGKIIEVETCAGEIVSSVTLENRSAPNIELNSCVAQLPSDFEERIFAVVSGDIIASTGISSSVSGNKLYLNSLLSSGSGISLSHNSGIYTVSSTGLALLNHQHLSNDITNFNSSISGLLPSITGSGYILSNFSNNIYTLSVSGLQPSGNYSVVGHSHISSDITNFNNSVSGLLPVKNILGGSGISISSSSGEYTVAVTGNFGLTSEEVDDRVSSLLIAGSSITLNYDDLNNQLTISTSGLQPSGNYSIVGHTHTSNEITDFNNAISGLLPPLTFSSLSGISGISVTNSGTNFIVSLSDPSVQLSDITDLSSYAQTFLLSSSSDNFRTLLTDETGSGSVVFNFSPSFSGIPTVPTAVSGTNSNQIASTAFVRTEISNLVDSAPSTLDTLNELAAALGDDPNFATTLTNSLAGKVNKSGDTMTGSLYAPSGLFDYYLSVNGTPVSISGHNHIASDITNFNTSVSGLLPITSVSGGNNITVNQSGTVFTVAVTGSLGLTTEEVDDRVSNLLVAGTGINLNYNDNSNTLTINTSGLQPSGNYSVVGHSHTSSDISDFNSSVSGLLPVKHIVSGTNISVTSVSGIYTINSTVSGVTESASIITTVFNKTGSPIPKMSAVYINGGQGDQPTVALAIATGDSTSAGTYGLTFESIPNMSTGKVVVFGALTGLNTDQFNPTAPTGDVNGRVLYLSPSVSGALTLTKPSAPNHIVALGTIVRTHQDQGIIEVRVQNGFELEELHNVAISGVTNGQFLQYNGSGLWVPSSSGNFNSLSINGTGVSVDGHTHSSANITDFNSSVSGLLPVTNITGGSNITVSQSGTVYSVAVTGSLGLTTEEVDDRVSGLLSGGNYINLNYDDNNNLLTISATGLQPSGNYSLAGHSHSSSDITDFNSAVSGLLPTNLVYTTGNQNIGGAKTFDMITGFVSGIETSYIFYDGTMNIHAGDIGINLQVASQNIAKIESNGVSVSGNLVVSGSGLLTNNINNFNEAVDDRVSNLLVPGLGIDISYDDNANTVTISDNTTATVGAALYLWANFR